MERHLAVYSPEIVSRETYEGVLRELGASFDSDAYCDTRVTRDRRHAWFHRYTSEPGEDPEGYLQDDDTIRAEKALGVVPRTLIIIRLNMERGAVNSAVDFVLLLAHHYPCVVVNEFGETSTPAEILAGAEPGYDGYRLDPASHTVVKGPPETPDEQQARLKQRKVEDFFGVMGVYTRGARLSVYTSASVSFEEFAQVIQQVGARRTSQPPISVYALEDGIGTLQFTLLSEEEVRREWDQLVASFQKQLAEAVGGSIQSEIVLQAGSERASVNLALDFLFEFVRQYPCIVQDRTGELRTPEDLLEFAQPGYLGYDWNAEHTKVVKMQEKPPEAS